MSGFPFNTVPGKEPSELSPLERGDNTDEHLISHRNRIKKLILFPMEQTMNCKDHKISCR